MHPADIQAELKKRGVTQNALAQKLGVSPVHISQVLNDPEKRPSDKVMKAIAETIGRDHREVFPEYYFNVKRRKKPF